MFAAILAFLSSSKATNLSFLVASGSCGKARSIQRDQRQFDSVIIVAAYLENARQLVQMRWTQQMRNVDLTIPDIVMRAATGGSAQPWGSPLPEHSATEVPREQPSRTATPRPARHTKAPESKEVFVHFKYKPYIHRRHMI